MLGLVAESGGVNISMNLLLVVLVVLLIICAIVWLLRRR